MTLISVAAASLLAASPAVAAAPDRHLILEVILNGRATGQVGEFLELNGAIYARPSMLRDLGLRAPASAEDAPVPLAAIVGLRARIDDSRQTLAIIAPDAALRPTELRSAPPPPLAPPLAPEFGVVVNYDLLATASDGAVSGGALFEARLFGPYGVLESTGVAAIAPPPGHDALVRLDTTYTFSSPDRMQRWRAGDVVSGALRWNRAVRLGGLQVSSDFSLRPDLITYPLPTLGASAAVPSTVSVLINGISQYSQTVPPGPFRVRTLPGVTGAGEVAVTVEDAVGRQTFVSLPFYASTALLTPGLTSYSAELGWIRRDYGLPTDAYSDWAANGSFRYGVSDRFTFEAHGEASEDLLLAGVGGAWQVGGLGVANAAVAASHAGGRPSAAERDVDGGSVSVGFERRSRRINFNLSGSWATAGYRDLATMNGAPTPRSALSASLGGQLGQHGSLSLAYVGQHVQTDLPSRPGTRFGGGRQVDLRTELATLSYSVPVARRFTFRATGVKDLRRSDGYGVHLGISATFGPAYVSAGASVDEGRSSGFIAAAKPAFEPGDLGYQVRATAGAAPRLTASVDYLKGWGRVSAGVDHSANGTAGRVAARGSFVWTAGDLFASDQIRDSFAVVRTGRVAGVPVLHENRRVGQTNRRGLLLVPSLLSYQNNRLALDTTGLPPDIEVGQTSRQIRPPDRSGVVIDFEAAKVNAGLLTLTDAQGAPIPAGSTARLRGDAGRPVGHGGQVYLTGLQPANRLVVARPDGETCVATFDYRPVAGDIPHIGPLTCR